jgi:hypothetical protein
MAHGGGGVDHSGEREHDEVGQWVWGHHGGVGNPI